jgi:hypothetical protein
MPVGDQAQHPDYAVRLQEIQAEREDMRTWICSECEIGCTLKQNSQFSPERCIYKERGTDKMAHWKEVMP